MAWKLAKDYNNPMWGPRLPSIPRGPMPPRLPRLPQLPKPPKPPAPPGYKYVWRESKSGW